VNVSKGQRGIANRVQGIPPSAIREIFDQAQLLRDSGIDVVDLQIGVPDFDTPSNIKEAAKRALDDGFVKYTANAGILPLRLAISERIQEDEGLTYDPLSEIIVTVGANEAVALCMLALLNPGDEVLIPEPAWSHAQMCAILAGAVPVLVPLEFDSEFRLDPDVVRSKITNRTRMLVLNSPHNPTGAVIDRETQQQLAQIAIESDIFVVSDEIYSRLTYDGVSATGIASVPGMQERTLVINGFSKTYAMTGWRMGWVSGPERLIKALLKIHQYTVTSTTSFAQIGALEALKGPQDFVSMLLGELDTRRQRVLETVQRLPMLDAIRPKGAFYVYVKVGDLGLDGHEFAAWLLENYHVAVIPGRAFGSNQDSFVRISFGSSFEQVDEGMARLEEACLCRVR
jgi:aminotransferase